MSLPAVPPDDSARVAALEETHLMFTPAEERFDRVTRMAARLLHTPVALITLVDGTRQWFKASEGMSIRQLPRELSFCAHAIAAGDHLLVGDTVTDERFADNPFVTGEPHIRAYAGKVIRAASGHAVGTLCVLDSKPREFSADDLLLLEDLSAIVEGELRVPLPGAAQASFAGQMNAAAREHALDPATRCWNHDAMVELLLQQSAHAEASGQVFGVGLVGIERFQKVSRNLGDAARDQVLGDMANVMRRSLGEHAALGRYDAETFVVLMPEADERMARQLGEQLSRAVAARPFQAGRLGISLGATVGMALWQRGVSLVSLVERAGAALAAARTTNQPCVIGT